MKKNDKHISYSIVFALMLAFFSASMCMYFAANDRSMVSYILFGITGVLALVQIIAAIVYACKKNRADLDELVLAYEIVAIVIALIVLAVPIFFIWIIEKIHDAVSAKHSANI